MLKTTQTKLRTIVLLLFLFSIITSFTNVKKNTSTEDFIAFEVTEEVPLFKGCDGSSSRKEAVECFNKKMMNHIKRNFTYPEEALENNIQGRVEVSFIINEVGIVKDIQANASNEKANEKKILEAEAIRIVSLLPKFTPGKHQGKVVNVKYGLPITFKMM
ncbi:energy transducer TonB [Flavobacterium sp. NRK F7]|uniref:energy transducer TonB n=1 Tax=Flavobacterium sp. NRK F7 TaxID=2954930 RepID=UPI002091C3B7|nr:energy transducer TonB [Flavobacterium sp. NRK F7]MCO6161453.1 energy transducer TonB [Flavobacterium sp. NRK F7]